MPTRRVNPKSIKIPAVRVTSAWNPEMLQIFKQSILTMGIVEPIICVARPDGLYLVDGLHRLQEAIANNQSSVEVVALEREEADVYLLNLTLNNLRGKTKLSEMVEVIGELWRTYNLDSDGIATKTGLPRDYIERLQTISQAHPALRAAVDEESIGITAAYEIARIPDPEIQERITYQQLQYRMPVARLREHIQATLLLASNPSSSLPGPLPTEPRRISCHFCHEEYELPHLSNPTMCIACYGTLVAAMQQAQRLIDSSSPLS